MVVWGYEKQEKQGANTLLVSVCDSNLQQRITKNGCISSYDHGLLWYYLATNVVVMLRQINPFKESNMFCFFILEGHIRVTAISNLYMNC
jgi:hypothetical protein